MAERPTKEPPKGRNTLGFDASEAAKSVQSLSVLVPTAGDDRCWDDLQADEITRRKELAQRPQPITFQERHGVFLKCLPAALLSTALAATLWACRNFELVPEEYLVAIEHPYAAQVFGVTAGYMMIMRLNVAVNRWDNGMACAQTMETRWRDAFTQIASFLAVSRAEHARRGNTKEIQVLRDAEKLLIHLFSLLHAISVTNLCLSAGRAYGHTSQVGHELFEHFRQVPIVPPTHLTRAPTTAHESEHDAGQRLSKQHWQFGLEIHGVIEDSERRALMGSSEQNHMVMAWIAHICSHMISTGLITVPPPIFSRVYQELSNGMVGFMMAYKVAVLPFPAPVRDISKLMLVVIVVVVPLLIEKFTVAAILTPTLTFFSTFGYLVIHQVTENLEMPFGEDYIDVPLREMHEAFNASLKDLSWRTDIADGFIVQKLGELSQHLPPPDEKVRDALDPGLRAAIGGDSGSSAPHSPAPIRVQDFDANGGGSMPGQPLSP